MIKNAVIEDVKISKVFDLWKRKPKCLAFNDTDVIVVTAKTADGKEVNETFFTCLNGNGGFYLKTPNKITKKRRERLAKFLKYYKLTESYENYNLAENINKWKNKEIKVIGDEKGYYIYIP